VILNQSFAQKIANTIMENIDYNINIMNEEGIIIASGNSERIGTFHKVACDVIKEDRRIDAENDQFNNVKNGINMPFHFEDKVIGVVGITGEPDKIVNIASMVKTLVELMVVQEYTQEKNFSKQNYNIFFVNKMLEIINRDNWEEAVSWGEKKGIDIDLPRCVVLFEIIKNNNNSYNKNLISSMILDIQQSPNCNRQDIVAEKDVGKIIIFKHISKVNDEKKIKIEILSDISEIIKQLESKYYVEIKVFVGSYYYEGIHRYKKSYREAKFLISNQKFVDQKNKIVFINDYVLEYLWSSIPGETMEHFMLPYEKELEKSPELIETLHALVKNDMNLRQTAEELFLHRNTVVFRMEKLKELLDFNPIHSIRDASFFQIISWYLYTDNNK
jgi:carbohydrate diacid regulator